MRARGDLIRAVLYIGAIFALHETMSLGETVILLAGGLVLLIAGIRFARHFFSDEATWERRRRRSNAPISTRGKRPSVKLSVRAKRRQSRRQK